MEEAIKPREQQKPGGDTSESLKNWNTSTGTPQTALGAQSQDKKPANKPNQGWKSTKRKNLRQKELPHFVRTEMEILKHLRRVNRDLRILLQPKYNCVSMAQEYKGHQPTRQCGEQPIGKAGQSRVGAAGKKSQNVLAKAINMKPKRPTQQPNPPTGASRVTPLQTDQSCTRKTQNDVQTVPQKSSTTIRRSARPLQRLMLYFKPMGKLDVCQCAQKQVIKDNKKSDGNEAIKSKTVNTLCSKLKRGLHATRTAKVKSRHTKLTEQPVEDNEVLKLKCREEKGLKHKVMERERILKQKVKTEKPLKREVKDEVPKQQVKKTEPLRPIAKEAEHSSPNVKKERTVKEKMLAFRSNFLRAEAKSLQNEDESKKALIVKKKQLFTRTADVLSSNKDCAQLEKKAVREIESTISHRTFGNCLPFFKMCKKAPVPVLTLTENAPNETELKKVCMKRKPRHAPTNIDHLPSSSHINMKYVEAIKAIRRHNRNIYKDPHETPSTSSLEEYFHVLSERMAREQKEADERKPRHRGRRGTSNYNVQRRRARPPII